MIDSSSCPPEQVVVDYAAGRLSAEDVQAFEEHLGNCPECMEAMEWVRFHFFKEDTEAEAEEESAADPDTQTLSPNTEADAAVTAAIDDDRFDLSLLTPTTNPGALGRLGNYDVLKLIGYGGMGVVFKAYDERLRRTVAIKALNRGLACSSTARRRFVREGRAAAAINHPNIVIIYHVEDHQDQPFLVMEYVGGCTLRDRLRKDGQLEPMPVLRISSQIAAALHAAHRQGIVHRDVKPANIMLEDGLERVKITDFGLARVSVDNVELTTGEMAVGTPAYMAPEQVRGEKIDARADLFALGCVMYAMLVGHSPFHGKCSLEMARKVLDDDPAPPHEVIPAIPGFLSEIVMRLLEKAPERRYQSAGELADTLNAHLAVLNQTPTDELNAVMHGGQLKRKLPRLGIALAIVAAFVLIGGFVGAWSLGLLNTGRSALRDANAGETGQTPSVEPAASFAVQPVTANVRTPASKSLERITVAKMIPADCSSLAKALQLAKSGSTVEFLDGETYDENILMNGEHWSGVKIVGQADHPPTITSNTQALVTIGNAPGVVLRNLRIQTKSARQHAIAIQGKVPGLTLDNLVVVSDVYNEFALVHITNRAAGTNDDPIRIQNCRFVAKNMAVVVSGEALTPIAHVHFVNNRFQGANVQLQFNRSVNHLHVCGNVFLSGTGIALGLMSQTCGNIAIENNTFYQCDPWLDLRKSPPDTKQVVIANNLILEPDSLLSADGYSLDEYTASWSFRCNYCETESSEDEEGLEQIMEFQSEIPVLSRDVDDEERFLRLAADSSLARAGAGEKLPSYVGAYAPIEK